MDLAAALSKYADTVGVISCDIAGAWKEMGAYESGHIEKLRIINPCSDFDVITDGLYQLALKRK